MEIGIGNTTPFELSVKSSGASTRVLSPLTLMEKLMSSSVKFDIGRNEVLFVNLRDVPETDTRTFRLKLGNHGNLDLILEIRDRGVQALSPLTFGASVARRYTEIEFRKGDTLVLRSRGARDPDGVEFRTPV